ncbi:autophagy protein Apg17-domain-containing protein [Phyllosticta citricarpa]|uniref:Autophagy-related protein 17 n=2 Tax=Phyllosticta TaxID=121621 RepID=A0ABR1L6Z7_9PEZI
MASPQSPAASAGSLDPSPPSLEQLVTHFVNAKRALSSIHHVWRANEFVTQARQLLEDDAVLSSKSSFLRKAIDEQLKTLKALRYGIELVGLEGSSEFKTLLSSLDESSHSLHTTLQTLRDTLIDPDLQTPGTPQKYLFDFIDSSNVDQLEASLRQCIDRTNEADSALGDTIDAFDASIGRLQDRMTACPEVSVINAPSPLPESFHSLESHATETASLLQSLVSHYDLCVTALKHTEGGNEAATRATSTESPIPTGADLPPDMDPNLQVNLHQLSLDVASLRSDAPPAAPLTEAERADMLAVLANDATEVDDVVAEIRDRVSDMEALASGMSGHIDSLQSFYTALLSVYRLLKDISKEIPTYLDACRVFQAKWGEEKSRIEEGVLALEGLREFYDGFLDAYDGLVAEMERRRQVERKMEAIAREAAKKLDKIYHDELDARNTFHITQGSHLPSDICPAVGLPPTRYEIVATKRPRDEEGADEGEAEGGAPPIEGHDENGGAQPAGDDADKTTTRETQRMPNPPTHVVEAPKQRMEQRRAWRDGSAGGQGQQQRREE